METSTTKTKRQTQTQKKSLLKSEDFTKLSFTELIERAQWYRKQLADIETFLQDGVNKVMPLPAKELTRQPIIEPPFTQGYLTPNIIKSNARIGDISFSSSVAPLPDMSALSQLNTGDLVVRGIEPQAEVYEVISEEDTLREVRNLLDNQNPDIL